MKIKSLLPFAALMMIAVPGFALADVPSPTQQVVRDSVGQIVTAMRSGTCVRSEAEAGTNACMRDVTVSTTRTVLTDAERVVYFEFNKSDLTPEARKSLNALAKRLKAAKDVKSASIVGFADRIGSDSYNVALSQRRAETVKRHLVQNGYVDVNVAEVRALGSSNPVTNCSTKVSRAQQISCLAPDRRVEVELTYTKEMVSQKNVSVSAVSKKK